MPRFVLLFSVGLCLILIFGGKSEKIEFRAITFIRNGLEETLDYIRTNTYRSNVDCAFGVALVKALIKTSYKNGTHVMDNSSLRILEKCKNIIKESSLIFENSRRNGNNWKFKNLVDTNIWNKPIDYHKHELLPQWIHSENVIFELYHKLGNQKIHNSDVCLHEIINSTRNYQRHKVPCIVSIACWNTFFRNGEGHGYYLTHKLLLLEVAKARGCIINEAFYDKQVTQICSSIMSEIVALKNYDKIHEYFDLFLEQVLLCGYEGFQEFIQSNWLFYVLKSQRPSGCFSDDLTDKKKSRLRRDLTYFEDGCNDHTTALGAAVLALYYNFVVNEENLPINYK
ncbi:UPF0764 protein C16orf89 homolog [Anthonomus grandis grandis]|uniref:UPF0764 protein C16orf89 homolog n=1 Tax=Anthonomus grandis grandis TaxID=2921223 RepID=UPI00216548F3|nr:UPF0764 protein C16orf89 homolog [Anthonomus grandis grandis]